VETPHEASGPHYEPLLEFSWLERRADGILFALIPALFVADGLIFVFDLGLIWLALVLAGGLVVGSLVGKALGDRMGRNFVGGMFLPYWLRWLCLFLALAALIGLPGYHLIVSNPGKAARPAAARGGEKAP
jgi:hypothetical protein